MAWCSSTDVQNALTETELIDLTDDSGAGTVNTTVLNALITSATGEVRSQLRQRYSSQCTALTTDAMVNEITLCLVVRNLYNRRQGVGMPLDWANRLQRAYDALGWLKSGEISPAEWTADSDLIAVGEQYYPALKTIPDLEADQETIEL